MVMVLLMRVVVVVMVMVKVRWRLRWGRVAADGRRCETGAGPCPARAHVKALLKHGGQWAPDETPSCQLCTNGFTAFNRKHHCRSCGGIFCGKCCSEKLSLSGDTEAKDVELVCKRCADSLKVNRSRNVVGNRVVAP